MRRPVVALAVGFGVSAVVFYAAVHFLGRLALGWVPSGAVSLLAAAGFAALFLVVDSGLFGLRTPMWQRQTPQQHFFRRGPVAGALLWGLDTGLVVTTFRVTSMTWVAIAVSLLGLVPWWAGVFYAAGFVIPSIVMIAVVPYRPDRADRLEPIWVIDRVSAFEPFVRGAAKVVFAAMAVASIAIAVI